MMTYIAPVLIGLLYTLAMSLIPEPQRRRFNAIMVAGAGAAYLSGGGFGGWEFAFTAVTTYCAYSHSRRPIPAPDGRGPRTLAVCG
ncbi:MULTISPECIES: DUF6010 family protein [Nocardia]|uniref:DUF6010 family protein n=1 Tax=Nocardia abscessus TaxID=120957 RepID=UPI001E5E7436|nr:DUF6010 family protein [Nocardia abscessus]